MFLYSQLEKTTLQQISTPYEKSIANRKIFLHVALILFSCIKPVYATVKGAFILNSFLNDPTYEVMHPPYNALVISSVVFGYVELFVALGSFSAMKRLKLQRVTHWLNDEGQEVDQDGKRVSRSANLGRLFGLAKPVSVLSFVSRQGQWK